MRLRAAPDGGEAQHRHACHLTCESDSLRRLSAQAVGTLGMDMQFSAAAREAHPNLDLDAFEDLLLRVEAQFELEITRRDEELATELCFLARGLLQSCLRRNWELAAALIYSLNLGLTVPLMLNARAILEAACLARDLIRRLERLVVEPTEQAMSAFADHLMNTTYGCRAAGFIGDPELYPMPNVLTLIDHSSEGNLVVLREFYDLLSEFAHPNHLGLHGLFISYTDELDVIRFPQGSRAMDSICAEAALGSATLGLQFTLLSWLAVDSLERQLTAAIDVLYE